MRLMERENTFFFTVYFNFYKRSSCLLIVGVSEEAVTIISV